MHVLTKRCRVDGVCRLLSLLHGMSDIDRNTVVATLPKVQQQLTTQTHLVAHDSQQLHAGSQLSQHTPFTTAAVQPGQLRPVTAGTETHTVQTLPHHLLPCAATQQR